MTIHVKNYLLKYKNITILEYDLLINYIDATDSLTHSRDV